jgi:hypothetical protein
MGDIHVISENDLRHWKKVGRRIRALCPIHNSRDRDLSIAPYAEYLDEDEQRLAGFGYCHSANCGATILVQEWNPEAAMRLLGRPVLAREPKVSLTIEDLEQAEAWQHRELQGLNKVYSHAASQLRNARAKAYLAQRGLGEPEAMDLLPSLGVAYIPRACEWKSPPPGELRKWCDRIIFPFTCANGERGYLGRALHLWEPGMDENEHKRVLIEHDKRMEEEQGKDAAGYQIRRWRKTYRSGFFHASEMAASRHLYVCEGPFDVIPLLLSGLSAVVAIAGTHLDVKAIPKTIFEMTLAYDADMQGKDAMAKTVDLLASVGVTSVFCTPPEDGQGKDWSERYRLHGVDGLAVLFQARPSPVPDSPVDDSVPDDGDRCPACQKRFPSFEGWNPDLIPERDVARYDPADGQLYCEHCRPDLFGDVPATAPRVEQDKEG